MIDITPEKIDILINNVMSMCADLMPVFLFIAGIITGLYILNSIIYGKRDTENKSD